MALIAAVPVGLAAVFLDRDGVLNRKAPEGSFVSSWDDFHVLPGVPQAILRLNRAGLPVIVVSNQRGIALGRYSASQVDSVHQCFQQFLALSGAHIDAFLVCPHDAGRCDCRKPLPGLFLQAAARFPGLTASQCVMIGDALVDMEFGRRLGMTTILVESDLSLQIPGAGQAAELASLRCASLSDAVDLILGRESSEV
jgi:D-glycero-D-manno-heptose 1,7-bisphosphate phosphatase